MPIAPSRPTTAALFTLASILPIVAEALLACYMWKQAKLPVTEKDLVARLQVLGLKVDQSTISKIEQGTRPVFDFEVVALAKAPKVSAGCLLEEANS